MGNSVPRLAFVNLSRRSARSCSAGYAARLWLYCRSIVFGAWTGRFPAIVEPVRAGLRPINCARC